MPDEPQLPEADCSQPQRRAARQGVAVVIGQGRGDRSGHSGACRTRTDLPSSIAPGGNSLPGPVAGPEGKAHQSRRRSKLIQQQGAKHPSGQIGGLVA